MFERIAAFHFGAGNEHPIWTLERELERTNCCNALVVLPEAFNLGRPYSSEPGMPLIERDIVVKQLSVIAQRFAIALVAGLLGAKPEGGGSLSSSAYFISDEADSLMCHKQGSDGSGHYSECTEDPDPANPIILKETAVITAVCMDIQDSQRFGGVARRALEAKRCQNFVCVPAAMSDNSWFGGAALGSPLQFLQRELGGMGNLILANRDGRGIGSFITSRDWRVLKCIEGEHKAENRLLIAQLDSQADL